MTGPLIEVQGLRKAFDGTGHLPKTIIFPLIVCKETHEEAIAYRDAIVERPDLRVLRDPFSAKPHVLFYATKRVGGGITDFRAVRLLRFI